MKLLHFIIVIGYTGIPLSNQYCITCTAFLPPSSEFCHAMTIVTQTPCCMCNDHGDGNNCKTTYTLEISTCNAQDTKANVCFETHADKTFGCLGSNGLPPCPGIGHPTLYGPAGMLGDCTITSEQPGLTIGLIVGIVGGVILVIAVILITCLVIKRRRKAKNQERLGTDDYHESDKSSNIATPTVGNRYEQVNKKRKETNDYVEIDDKSAEEVSRNPEDNTGKNSARLDGGELNDDTIIIENSMYNTRKTAAEADVVESKHGKCPVNDDDTIVVENSLYGGRK